MVVRRTAQKGDDTLDLVAHLEPDALHQQVPGLADSGCADDQVAEAPRRSGSGEHGGGPLVCSDGRTGGIRYDERRCGCRRRGGFGHPHHELDPARRIEHPQLAVRDDWRSAPVDEAARHGVDVLGLLAAELDPDESADVAFVDEDGGAAVAAGEPGRRAPSQPEFAVEGGQGAGVGNCSGEAEQSVQSHQWVTPSGPMQRLRSSPTVSTVVTISSPGERKRPRAMPTPSGVPVKMRSPGESRQIEDRYDTSFGTLKISCAVEDSWTTSPHTSQRNAMSSGFSKASMRHDGGSGRPIGAEALAQAELRW